nr:MAG TPA: hypothetical protein [Caudoviricetes sp.]
MSKYYQLCTARRRQQTMEIYGGMEHVKRDIS